jgi:hypothetical protein
MDKEQWKDEVLASVKGLKRAEPNPFLFTRIKQRLREEQTIALIPKAKIRLAAIGFALLCALNVWVVLSSAKQQNTRQSNVSALDIFPAQLY